MNKILLLTLIALLCKNFLMANTDKYMLYIGTFSENIYQFKLDTNSGELTAAGAPTPIKRPGFLAIDPENKFLYSVSRDNNVGVTAFKVNSDATLTKLNEESSSGDNPCHLVVDKLSKNVLVANYSSGSISSIPIDTDGSLKKPASVSQHEGSSINPKRQQEPHAHSINLSPDNRFAFVADLGTDKIHVYKFNSETGILEAQPELDAKLSPGSGPRHFAFHPSGAYAYVINELTSTITALKYNSDTGQLSEIQTISTLPEGSDIKNSTAEIRVHPNGRFLYGSNRGHNSIAVFSIDQMSGKLTAIEHESSQGDTPRNFNLDPSGKFLIAVNQNSNNIVVFKVDQDTGKLNSTGYTATAPKPVCVLFSTDKAK